MATYVKPCLGVLLLANGCAHHHPVTPSSEVGPSPQAVKSDREVEVSDEAPPRKLAQADARQDNTTGSGSTSGSFLKRLLTKDLGTVDDGAARVDPDQAEALRAICDRVILAETGKLGCDTCVGCEDTDSQVKSETLAMISGNFSDDPGDEALIAMWDTDYSYRYFFLIRDGDHWQVRSTVVLEGLPSEHRRLRVPGQPDVLIRITVSAGAPGPTEVDAVRFTREEVLVTSLILDLRAFEPCNPSDFSFRGLALRDLNADGIEDVVVSVEDYSAALDSPDARAKASKACAAEKPFRASFHRRSLQFMYDNGGFTASASTVKLLRLDEGRINSAAVAWEISTSF